MGHVLIKDAKIKLNSQDLSANSNEVSIEITRPTDECEPFGADYVETGAGAMRVTFRIRGYYAKDSNSLTDVAEAMAAGGEEAAIEIYPEGTAVGNDKYAGTAGITNVSPTFTKGRFAMCEVSGYINDYARSTATS